LAPTTTGAEARIQLVRFTRRSKRRSSTVVHAAGGALQREVMLQEVHAAKGQPGICLLPACFEYFSTNLPALLVKRLHEN
jgi:hypothetical protein